MPSWQERLDGDRAIREQGALSSRRYAFPDATGHAPIPLEICQRCGGHIVASNIGNHEQDPLSVLSSGPGRSGGSAVSEASGNDSNSRESGVSPVPGAREDHATCIRVSSGPGQSSSDVVIRASVNGKPVGQMIVSVLPLVHEMEIEPGMLQRKVADALLQYASGYVKASGFTEVYILVGRDNDRMQRYVSERATAEDPAALFIMEVR